MSDTISSSVPKQHLEKIRAQLEAWRAERKSPKQKIPEELWQKIAKVAPYFDQATLRSTLKIEAKQLRNRNIEAGTELAAAEKGATSAPPPQANKSSTSTAESASHTKVAKPPVKAASHKAEQQADKQPATEQPASQLPKPAMTKAKVESAKPRAKTNSQKTKQQEKKPTSQPSTPSSAKQTKPNAGVNPAKAQAQAKARANTKKTKPLVNQQVSTNKSQPAKQQDALYAVELKSPSGAVLTVRLPWQELLLFVKQAAE